LKEKVRNKQQLSSVRSLSRDRRSTVRRSFSLHVWFIEIICDIFYLNRIVFSCSSNLCVNPANDFGASILLACRWKTNYKYVYVFFIVLSLVPH
jgi:glycerol uptake facilitator-like aquaporin